MAGEWADVLSMDVVLEADEEDRAVACEEGVGNKKESFMLNKWIPVLLFFRRQIALHDGHPQGCHEQEV